MSIASVVSDGANKFDKAKSKVEETIKFWDDLQKMDIPESIESVAKFGGGLVEQYVPPLPGEALRKLGQHGIKVQDANKVLSEFELEIVDKLTVSNASIFFTEINKTLRAFEWLIGHSGEIVLLIGSALAFAQGYFGQDIAREFKRLGSAMWDFLFSDEEGIAMEAEQTVEDASGKLVQTVKDFVELVISSVVLAVVADTVIKSIEGYGIIKFKTAISPVLNAYQGSVSKLGDLTLPQKPGRKNRVRHSKKNSG
jgi:hypothetical protein